MAREGFFRRTFQGIKNLIFRPEPPRPEPPRQPPPSPPRPPGGPSGGGPGIWTGPYRETWQDFTTERDIADIQERTGYSENEIFQAHFEVFLALNPEGDRDELREMWEDYIMAFVSDGMTHDTFFETWNIDPRDFDWEMWRDAMGYSNRGK